MAIKYDRINYGPKRLSKEILEKVLKKITVSQW